MKKKRFLGETIQKLMKEKRREWMRGLIDMTPRKWNDVIDCRKNNNKTMKERKTIKSKEVVMKEVKNRENLMKDERMI